MLLIFPLNTIKWIINEPLTIWSIPKSNANSHSDLKIIYIKNNNKRASDSLAMWFNVCAFFPIEFTFVNKMPSMGNCGNLSGDA